MTKQNKNWEERLIKEYREQDFECEEEKEIFWLDKLKTLMIDTLNELRREELEWWDRCPESKEWYCGYNSVAKEQNQRIDTIKKRYE